MSARSKPRGFWLLSVATVVGIGSAVYATTHHVIKVDGVITDFASDEKTAGDAAGDSTYGTNNDLTTLYVTWDDQNLYLGFAYKAWGTAVIYLVDTGKQGGVSNFCPSSGYKGAFPSNMQGPDFDLMVGMWVPPDIIKQPTPYIYSLDKQTSTDITFNAGVQVMMKETADPKVPVHDGVVEASIPWDALYGLGAGLVQPGAKIRVVGVIRGQKDGDGLGDVSPNCSGPINGMACGTGTPTQLDKFHEAVVDGDCDGKPDKGCAPGQGTCPGGPGAPCPKKDSGPPDLKPDTKPAQDAKAWPDVKAWPDTKAWPDVKAWPDTKQVDDLKPHTDGPAASDSKTAADKGTGDGSGDAPASDAVLADGRGDAKDKPKLQAEDGCACSAQGSQSMSVGLVGLCLVGLAQAGRRRRRR